ncbi:MAG: peptide chain release factor N(5)-glutamine methyltransferase [Bacteroidales bacterium]
MGTKYTIKKIISLIKSELKSYYPIKEIDSFIFIILNHLLGYSRAQIHLKLEKAADENLIEQINFYINELKNYKPIQYIMGKTEFYDLLFQVNSGVLIPRPETEELVELIIKENQNHFNKILDIGTGSGCIAIALAKNLPKSYVYAVDNATDALALTRQNSKLNHVDIHISHLDILDHNHYFNESFDIIVSNPPYVTEKEKELMQPNVLNFEPQNALFVPDNNPLLYYRAIIDFSLKHLNKDGRLYLEVNENFGIETAMLLEEKNFHDIQLKKDINDKYRMLRCILK